MNKLENNILLSKTSVFESVNRTIFTAVGVVLGLLASTNTNLYTNESYKQFIPKLTKKLNLHKISLEVLENNERAIKLYNKLGFIHEGVKRDEVFKNGKWVNSILMSIIVDENM